MSKKVKYLAYAIAVVLVTGIMTVAIWAATSATSGISANVSWTASAGIEFELEAWVVNNEAGNGIGNTTTPKSITKQIVTASTSNSTAQNLAGDLACGFYDGSNDGVNNPSNIVFTYKIKNTGSEVLKVTATKTPTNQAESGTTASNHKPAVALSSKLDSTDNTSSCISSITGSGFNIPAGKTLEYIVTLSISNADLSITSFDAGVTFSFGTAAAAGTPTIYVNGVQQSSPVIDGATTVGDYLDALDGSQYPGYFYDEDLTIYVGEDDIVTNDTRLYTKPATLDKLTFTSNGDGTCSVAKNGKPTGEVVIPLVSPAGDCVTSIGYWAFSLCDELTNVIITKNIRIIDESAFEDCTSLISVGVLDNITIIGMYAFSGCSSLRSIEIPCNTYVDKYAFQSCTGLESVTIGSSMMEHGIFWMCTNIVNVTILDSVEILSCTMFCECTSLKSIYIPSSVTTISSWGYLTDFPFVFCSPDLKIYCGASEQPQGWEDGWNFICDKETQEWTGEQFETFWGVTREQYNSLYA